MMPSQHLTNIKGSIDKYADLASAKSWLSRALLELRRNEVAELIHSIYEWAIHEVTNRTLIDEVLGLLAEFDAPGDKSRRDEFERVWQQRLDEERAKAERLRA